MSKTKTKKVRNTADLVVHHARKHLAVRPHLRLAMKSDFLSRFADTGMFALAGVCVMLVAFHFVNTADIAFMAENATDYTAQGAFYTGEEMHGSASEFASIRMKIHEAALASELSRALNAIGVFLIFGVLWFLHRKHGIFNANRAGFTIRRIR